MSLAPLAPELREELAAGFAGELVGPADPLYEKVRHCHNGLIDREPVLFARCRGTADVADAVRFATAEDLEIAVRGGGHNVGGLGVCDGGLVIDLALMRGVDVDPETRTARAQGGALWSDLNREAALHGLAVTGGAISTTGIGGYTLGGGLGWLMGRYGLAADNLREAEVVLATGDVVRTSAEDRSDLFWALRGGGGNFGVVTQFVFDLHPVAEIVGGLIAHPIDAARDVLRLYRDATANAPDELEIFGGLVHAPDGSGTPLAALVLCHCGDRAAAERDVRPLLDWGDPAMVEVGPMPYPVMNTLLDDGFPAGSLNYWKSTFVDGVADDLIDTVAERFASCPTPMGGILFEHFHGAVTRVDPTATAVPHRSVGHNLLIPTVWTDPAITDACIGWTRETFEAVRSHRSGSRWLNYYGADEDEGAIDDAYGPNRGRLARVKGRYDPGNVFHINQNIRPA